MLDKNLAVNDPTHSDPAAEHAPTGTPDVLEPAVPSGDQSEHQQDSIGKEPKYIPYSRFKEVIDERNRLRNQMQECSATQPEPEALSVAEDEISDEEINVLWQQNPAQAARLAFAQMNIKENNRKRLTQQSLYETYQRYPELADPTHELPRMAKDIICREVPELRHNPRGLSIAVEMAAARFYRGQYEKMAQDTGLSRKGLEATRSANLKNAFMETAGYGATPSYHNCLSSDEQRIAQLMGVPTESYMKNKRKTWGGK
ncbi:hypothetical protein KDK77_02365 [bacterium]|nr:hypothetical protein [bacterium]